jgi:hypothetical protein
MPEWPKELHQPEPWTQEGQFILSAAGWRLAKAVFEEDARRIVAAINDTQGIPTVALEAGFIRDLLELKIWPRADLRTGLPALGPSTAPPETFFFDRRISDRRRR